MRKSVSTESTIFPSLNSLIKRGKLASKDLVKVLQQSYQLYSSNLTCRSGEVPLSFVSPGDYEFSCSNSPAYPAFYHISKQRNRGSKHGHHRPQIELFYHGVVRSPSPLIRLPGYGHSPEVRQPRVTDSPFSVKDMEEDDQVDIDAEEFIERFYKDLESQRRAAVTSWL